MIVVSKKASIEHWGMDDGQSHLRIIDRMALELLPTPNMPLKMFNLRIAPKDLFVISIPGSRICDEDPMARQSRDLIEDVDTGTDEIGFLLAAPRTQTTGFGESAGFTNEEMPTRRDKVVVPTSEEENAQLQKVLSIRSQTIKDLPVENKQAGCIINKLAKVCRRPGFE